MSWGELALYLVLILLAIYVCSRVIRLARRRRTTAMPGGFWCGVRLTGGKTRDFSRFGWWYVGAAVLGPGKELVWEGRRRIFLDRRPVATRNPSRGELYLRGSKIYSLELRGGVRIDLALWPDGEEKVLGDLGPIVQNN